jgi:hypothetical protein
MRSWGYWLSPSVLTTMSAPSSSARTQALVAHVVHELGDAVLAGHLDGAVGAAVVDDEHDDVVDAGDLPRDRGEHGGEGLLLVEARDLHDEPHDAVLSCSGCWSA